MRLSPPVATSYLAWAARISSVFSLALLSLFFLGKPDDGAPVPALGWDEWLLFLFFPIGLAAGMILGWWHCQLGGIVAVASLAAFYTAAHHELRFPLGKSSVRSLAKEGTGLTHQDKLIATRL